MTKGLVVAIAALVAGVTLPSLLAAQTASTKATATAAKPEKWNTIPPLKRSDYAGKKSAPAPRRDVSGIWDPAEFDGARQTSGALEHPALLPGGRGSQGGQADETGAAHPVPYTPAGLAALKANHPSGPGLRQVPAALTNDPLEQCDPMGFPRMELYQFRTIELVQTANQVVFLNGFYGNWRIIWTDGRELPKDPEPRWNGYSVGKWVDDYTFVVQTTGLNTRTWIDHAGRPHSDELRVEERLHRVDHDNMELTVTINDPKMYTEPWVALNKFPLHLQPPDFDIPELLCSPIDMAEYNKQIGDAVLPDSDKK